MNETLRVTAQDGVLTITLDRPKANAINVSTSLALYAAFRRLQDDDRLRVAISELRGKLGLRQAGLVVHAVTGIGYRFAALEGGT